jgi:hypothetical protein
MALKGSAAAPRAWPQRPQAPGQARCRRCTAPPASPAARVLRVRTSAVKEGDRDLAEQPARLWGRERKGGPQTPPPDPNDQNSSWGIFDLSRYSHKWDVPWGPGRTAGGMALWFGSFVSVAVLWLPLLFRASGAELADLSAEVGDSYHI